MMRAMDQLALPISWEDGNFLATGDGRRLRKFGSVQKACEIMDGCDRQVIYDLYHAGLIRGYKNNPTKKNSHLRIDLLSVWNHKHSQL